MVVDPTLTPSTPGEGGPDPDLRPGQAVGEYEIERKIGQGGFGAVFKAVHPLIGKLAAIKVLSQRFSVDPQMGSRFVAEARAVNQIRHHNIIDIFSFGTLEDGRLYYVMEYLDGEPLDRRLARGGPMALDEAIPILRALARALDAAHAKGIAHRDLKAENVFLAAHPDGVFPKLLDFGIAKLMAPEDPLAHKTRTGAPMGTPHYMSPEQCHGRDVDHRTDMYAFGVLAYLMLTGVYPLDGDGYMAILMRQVHDEPAPPSSHRPELPAGVDAAITWLMRKDPAARPATLIAAVRMLEEIAGGDADAGTPPARPGARPRSAEVLATLPIEPGATAPGGAVAAPLSGIQTPGDAPAAAGAGAEAEERGRPGSAPGAEAEERGRPGSAPGAARGPEARTAGESPAAARRRPAPHVLLAGAAVAAAIAVIAVIAVRSGERDAAQAQESPAAAIPADAAPAAEATADAAPAVAPGAAPPARPADVFVTIEGAPPNTEVRRAGVLLGTAPGRIQLPRSDAEVLLVLSADGHVPATLAVVPSEDLTRTVKLSRRTARVRPPPRRAGGGGKPGGGGSGDEPSNALEQFPPPKQP